MHDLDMRKHRINVKKIYAKGSIRQQVHVNVQINANIKRTRTYQYNAKADGQKKIFTNQDELINYGHCGILDPCSVSLINVFVNGVLQPPVLYHITKGKLEILSTKAPPKDAIIMIQFVQIY